MAIWSCRRAVRRAVNEKRDLIKYNLGFERLQSRALKIYTYFDVIWTPIIKRTLQQGQVLRIQVFQESKIFGESLILGNGKIYFVEVHATVGRLASLIYFVHFFFATYDIFTCNCNLGTNLLLLLLLPLLLLSSIDCYCCYCCHFYCYGFYCYSYCGCCYCHCYC